MVIIHRKLLIITMIFYLKAFKRRKVDKKFYSTKIFKLIINYD